MGNGKFRNGPFDSSVPLTLPPLTPTQLPLFISQSHRESWLTVSPINFHSLLFNIMGIRIVCFTSPWWGSSCAPLSAVAQLWGHQNGPKWSRPALHWTTEIAVSDLQYCHCWIRSPPGGCWYFKGEEPIYWIHFKAAVLCTLVSPMSQSDNCF